MQVTLLFCQSSQRRWEARAATAAFSNSRQTMCPKSGFLWIFICSPQNQFFVHICIAHRTRKCLYLCSAGPLSPSAKSQDETERDLGRHSPLSQVPKSCSRFKTPACLITEVPYCLWVLSPVKLTEALQCHHCPCQQASLACQKGAPDCLLPKPSWIWKPCLSN